MDLLHVGVCCAVVSVPCSHVVTCLERADLLAVCLLCFVTFPNMYWSTRGWGRETGLSPPVKYFTDRSNAVLLLWIFYEVFVLCLLCLCARLFICALWSPSWKGLTSWLSFVVSTCEFVTFPLVSWVRCGTLL